jgi:hypothetical protein
VITASLGTAELIDPNVLLTETGFSVTASVGSVTTIQSALVPVTGLVATGNVGDNQNTNVWGEIAPNISTVWNEIAA